MGTALAIIRNLKPLLTVWRDNENGLRLLDKDMKPHLFSRLTKPFLITTVCAVVGFGMITHASAQKGTSVEGVKPYSSSFFSFDLLGQDKVLIRATIMSSLQDAKIGDVSFRDAPAMQAFYAAREDKPIWVETRGNNHGRVAGILQVLEDSWTQALNPKAYHVVEIRNLLNASTPQDKARLELLVSDAVVRYGRDMTGMHLPPNAIGQDPQFWRKPLDATQVLENLDTDPAGVVTALQKLAPQDMLYMRMREELIALTQSPDRAQEEFLPISFNSGILRPNDLNREVPRLRGRLGLEYDPAFGSERKYDDNLAAAVMTFQRENGLEADGNIGPKTLAMLNRSTKDKIKQIAANMERLRWLDETKPDRYILVNIPSQTLWAVDQGNVVLQMPVIVGRPERATKSFVTEISGVRFNPKWTVPPTIKANDFLPHLQADPNYLVDKGIEVYYIADGKRTTLDSTAIDWSTVTKSDLRHMRMVQSAGDNNALGRVRVLMENPYDIYLHDTSAPELFSKPERALSSGCVRMSNPEAVARFILAGNENWSDQRMRAILDSQKTTEIQAAINVPVFLVYQTVWLDDAGRLIYGPDIYKQDRALYDAMISLKAFHIPEPNKVKFASIESEQSLR